MNDWRTYATFLCVLALAWRWRRNRGKPPYPPGPKGYPIIGNTLNFPRNVAMYKAFASMAKSCNSDVLYLRVATKDFVVLTSDEAISDLLEKRSNIYADRPEMPMLDLMGETSWNMSIMEYGREWKNSRKLFYGFMNPRAVVQFDGNMRKHTHRLLSRLAETPQDFVEHVNFMIGALIMEIVYGFNVESRDDKYLRATELACEHSEKAMSPGAFLVDVFPILRHVPEWFPGAGFKTFARVGKEMLDIAIERPLERVKESLKSDRSNSSVASSCFGRVDELASEGFGESTIRAVVGTMYIGAVDTITLTLQGLFLALALHPDVVKKAQAELDNVIGNELLPDLSDEVNLPYICAFVKELLRWVCPLPIVVPKRVTEDDIYKGYHIPSGATIIENAWSICYDESLYPDPHAFNPERFLKDGTLDRSVKDPVGRVFGSGRRSCPGKHFANRNLFLNVACILSVFDIEAPAGKKLEARFEDGLVRRPLPFECAIKPRSEARLALVRDACAADGDS